MSKKKKKSTNHQVKMTPENFIRKKARNLSLYKCYITEDWKENGEGNIIIERKHGNGNITLGIFLVDVFCLGVRNTFYQYNISELEEEELRESFSEDNNMVEADYNLVHNIILAAAEYAEEYGFKPHKDFERITQYILEEDTDDIPLMEIECGKDGKPFFVASEEMNDKEISRIISTLEKTAGPGNYNYLLNEGPLDEPPDDYEPGNDESDEERISDVVDHETLQNWKEQFLKLIKSKENKIDEKEEEELIFNTDKIIDAYYVDEINNELFILEDAFGHIEIMTDVVPDEFLGLQYATKKDDVEKARELTIEIAEYNDDLPKLTKKLMKVAPNLPVSHYFRIKQEQFDGNEKTSSKLVKQAREKFPDYPPFEFLSLALVEYDDDFELSENYLNYDLAAFYDGRQSFFKCEVEDFLTVVFMWNLDMQDVPAVFAIRDYVDEHEDLFSHYFFGFAHIASNIFFTSFLKEFIASEDPEFAEKVEKILG
ncbi:MAG: hypothetical protein ACOCV9_01895 [Marinilabiliaceae bacterium]